MLQQNFILTSQILRGKWLIDSGFANGALPILKQILDGTPIPPHAFGKERNPKIASTNGWRVGIVGQNGSAWLDSFAEAPPNSTAHVKISGPVMRQDGLCSKGMESIGKIIQSADNSPNISAIVLEVSSPGGTVDGTETLANIIKNCSTKTYAFSHFAASAAYWLVSACDEIWASSRTAEFGSIGVMLSFVDWTKAMEAEGATFHELYSSLSSDKNGAFNKALKGDYEELIKEGLDPIAEIFRQEMRDNRGLDNAQMTGKVYMAETALEHGMIDRIGSMDELVAHIKDNGAQPNSNGANRSTNKANMSTGNSEKPSLWDRLTGSSKEIQIQAEENLTQMSTDLEKATANLSAQKIVNAELSATVKTLTEEKTALQTQLVEANEKLATQTKVAEENKALADSYGAQAGAEPTTPKKETGDIEQKSDKKPIGFNPNAKHNISAGNISRNKRK